MCCPDKAVQPPPDRAFVELRISDRTTALPIDNTFTLKVITIGESNTGKSQLVKCMEGKPFAAANISTIGVELISFVLEDREKRYKVQLWDTAGQERFRAIVRSYYRAVQVVLLCFSLDDTTSMEKVAWWLEEAIRQAPNAAIIVVGTKLDLIETEPRLRITTDEFRRSITDYVYVETSAKSGAGMGLLKACLIKEARRLDRERKVADDQARLGKTSPIPIRLKAATKK